MMNEIDILTARLDGLERQNTRLRWAALLVPAVALLLGAAQAATWKGKTITAEEIILIDAEGKNRAKLHVAKGGAELILADQDGTSRVYLGANSETPGPLLQFYTKAGKTALSAGQSKDNGVGFVDFLDEGQFKGGVGGNMYKK